MPLEESLRGSDLLRLLELLAAGESPARFDELPKKTQQAEITPAVRSQLNHAKNLALEIHGRLSKRSHYDVGLNALVDTARELAHPYNLDDLLKVMTRRARLLLHFDMAWVSVHDPADGSSYVRAAAGHTSALTVGFRVPSGGGIGNEATGRSAPFWSSDYLTDDRFTHSEVIDDVVRAEGLHAILAIPLEDGNTAFGVLYIASRNVRQFTADEITLMSSLGDLAAVAIEKARLLNQVRTEVTELELGTSRALSSSSTAWNLRSAQSRLINVVLEGCSLRTLALESSKELDGSLLIRDLAGQELCKTGDIPDLEETNILKTALDAWAEQKPVQSADGIWVRPISAGNEQLGLLVLRPNQPFTDYGIQLVQIIAEATAVLLMMQRSNSVAEGRLRDELFDDLLYSSGLSPQQRAKRLSRMPVDLNEPHVIVIAQPETRARSRAMSWASSYVARYSGLKSVRGDRLVLLLPGSDARAAALAVSKELSPLLDHAVTVTAAGPASEPDDLISTYQEAMRCLDAMISLGNTGSSASAQELGFLGILLSDSYDIDGFVASTIGPVLDYDDAQCSELTQTLEAYFQSGRSPANSAELLHVHPNTVSRRLERVSTLLGSDWQMPERSLEVQIALRLHRTRSGVTSRPR